MYLLTKEKYSTKQLPVMLKILILSEYRNDFGNNEKRSIAFVEENYFYQTILIVSPNDSTAGP